MDIINLINSFEISKCTIEKDTQNIEYEIKFECLEKERTLLEYLMLVKTGLSNTKRYIFDNIHNIGKIQSNFFTDSNYEYSIFPHKDKVTMKVKKHSIIKNIALPVFKNEEYFIYDIKQIIETLKKEDIVFVGNMIKERIKAFILDVFDGRIYSLVIAICKTANQSQYQLEVEYFGHIHGYDAFEGNNEQQILDHLVDLCSKIQKVNKNQFAPSIERKYEFVTKFSSMSQAESRKKKKDFLDQLGGSIP